MTTSYHAKYFARELTRQAPPVVVDRLSITPKEEAMLIERFGEQYRDYIQKTGKFVPRFFR